MTKRQRQEVEKIVSAKIQAYTPEGGRSAVEISNAMTSEVLGTDNKYQGTTNSYTKYDHQIDEVYKKYNGEAQLGIQQTRAIVDLRSSFIGGEGLSVSAAKKRTGKWIKEFLREAKLTGSLFSRIAKGSELTGHGLVEIIPGKTEFGKKQYPKIIYIPWKTTKYRIPFDEQPFFGQSGYFDHILVPDEQGVYIQRSGHFVYFRTGGDDLLTQTPTPKIAIVLTDMENYDRALKALRPVNHYGARITPVIKTSSAAETSAVEKKLAGGWRVGQAWVGTADFRYESTKTGPQEGITIELQATVKNVSTVTGVPVHWIGWPDLMSNRSTAETLYDVINAATVTERTILSEFYYELIVKAMDIYSTTGGDELSGTVDRDFEVKIPIVDYQRFLDLVRGLSIAYKDEVISQLEYRSYLPGLGPVTLKEEFNAKTDRDNLGRSRENQDFPDHRSADTRTLAGRADPKKEGGER